jgi:uncharacterized protein with beta-barrel porin domain
MVRDAALVGAHASLALSRDIRLDLDYTGQLASREKSPVGAELARDGGVSVDINVEC